MALVWSDDYKIGNAEIDTQHKKLFGLASGFLAATTKADLRVSAMHFFNYTRTHFDHEESLMTRIGYPAMATHVKQHNDLIGKLSALSQHIASDSLEREGLETFISDWLLNHVAHSDTQLAKFVTLHARAGGF